MTLKTYYEIDIYRPVLTVRDCQEVCSEQLVIEKVKAHVYEHKNKYTISDAVNTNTSTYKAIVYWYSDIKELDIAHVFVTCDWIYIDKGRYKVEKVACYQKCWKFDHLELRLSVIC